MKSGLTEALRSYPVCSFIVLAFTLSYSVGILLLMTRPFWAARFSETAATYVSRSMVVYGPGIAAMLVTLAQDGRAGAYRLLRTLHPGRCWAWILPLPFIGVAVAVASAISAGSDPRDLKYVLLASWQLLAIHLVLQFIFVGCGEELGWRGWLLPRLLTRCRRGTAAALVGIVWVLWHAPVLLSGLKFAAAFLVGVSGLSFLFAWLWARTDGNIFVIAAAHASVNAPFFFFEQKALHLPSAWTNALLLYAAAGTILVLVRWSWWRQSA